MSVEKLLERIRDEIADAVQADTENGVRWLNEIAAKNYLKEYPATRQALHNIAKWIDERDE